MELKELARLIYEKAYITGEFLLRSGQISHEYFDKYQFEAEPQLLSEIASAINNRIEERFDGLAALEMGGIPIATAISMINKLPMVFVRKKAKEYGTRRIAEGMDIKGKNLLVVEDVVTSGGQIILSVEELRKVGANIKTAVCVIDREQGGKENLSKVGIELISLFTMSEIKKFAKV